MPTDRCAPGSARSIGRCASFMPFVDRIAVAIYDPKTTLLKTFVHSSDGDDPLPHYQTPIDDVPSLKKLLDEGRPRVIQHMLTFEEARERAREAAGPLGLRRELHDARVLERRVPGIRVLQFARARRVHRDRARAARHLRPSRVAAGDPGTRRRAHAVGGPRERAAHGELPRFRDRQPPRPHVALRAPDRACARRPARPRRRVHRAHRGLRPAARHRQDRHPGRDPAQARGPHGVGDGGDAHAQQSRAGDHRRAA